MEPYAILMLCFAALMVIFALLVYKGQTGWIKSIDWVSVHDKGEYAKFLGKSLFAIAGVIALSGLSSMIVKGIWPALIMFVGVIAIIVIICKKSKEYFK